MGNSNRAGRDGEVSMSGVINVSGIFHEVIRLLNTDTSITFGSVLIYGFFFKKNPGFCLSFRE